MIASFSIYCSNIFSQEVPGFTNKPELNKILENAQVDGSILIYDYIGNEMISNDFKWAESGYLPASTFKIPNSIIALETGVIASDTSVIKDSLVRQLNSPLLWEDSIKLMAENGVDTVIEVGPKKVLSGLIKRIVPDMKIFNVEDSQTLEDTLNAVL